MSAQPPIERRPLIPLLLLHFAASAACFAFFTSVPIIGCLVLIAICNDPGGPLFFPIFVLGVLLFAGVITGILAGAALLSDLLRRHYRIPVWVPPIGVFLLVTVITWLLVGGIHPVVPPIAGSIIAVAFIIHWAAISTVWFLPRMLFRHFRVQNAPPKG